ncbi:LysR family transcriptional regulator [Burkholderia perseverans]|uniref:LysR family transcriptional regulator n=1 Tax=Burkholderia perseverans TaxID=2615214 RepID=UPI001FEE06EE|nr:LysR family transcriptional regulator [Burkholderia perseverans]
MDRFEAMTMLITAVEQGSFSAAARELRVPAATLTRKITDLEARLDARLLVRTTRGLTLTDTGIGYLAAARRILDLVDEQEREASGEFTTPRGELVVTAPVLFGHRHVLPHIAAFLAQFPEINITLEQSDRNVDLLDAQVDLAVRIGRLPDSSLIATQVGTMRTVVCASPAFLDRHGTPRTPADLPRLPCIVVNGPLLAPHWHFRAPGAPDERSTLAITPRLRVSAAASGAEAAVLGVGLTRLLHYQAADAIEAGTLRVVLSDYEIEPTPIHLVHVSRGQMPLKLRRFLDFLVPRLRASFAHLSGPA